MLKRLMEGKVMIEVVNDIYTFIALAMLGGYATFAFAVAYTSKSIRALRTGLILSVLVVFFSGCASNPHGALSQGDTKACAPYALTKASQRLGGSVVASDIERIFYGVGEKMGAMDVATTIRKAKDAGLIEGGMEVFSMEHIKLALLRGDVLLTLPVYSGGLPSQFWATEGDLEGQHAILCIGYKNGLFTLLNSWGSAWGSNGRAWLWEDGLEEMVKDGRARAWVIK